MTSPQASTHRRDTKVIMVAVILALAAAWATAFLRIRDMRAEKAAEVAQEDDLAESKSIDWFGACNRELNAYCPMGGQAPVPCLKAHEAALSTVCAEHLHNFVVLQPWRGACADDAYRLCPNMLGYDGKECLSRRLAEVSPTCRTFYATLSEAAN